MNSSTIRTVCYAIALAVGVAVIVTNIINPLGLAGVANLLGIGVAALGLAGLQRS